MKIEVNISKASLFVIISGFAILIGIISVYATVRHEASDVYYGPAPGKSVEYTLDNILDKQTELRVFAPGSIPVATSSEVVWAQSRSLVPVKEFSVGQYGTATFSWNLKAAIDHSNHWVYSVIEKNDVAMSTEAECQTRNAATGIVCSKDVSFAPGDTIKILARGKSWYLYQGTQSIGHAIVSDAKASVATGVPVITADTVRE